MLDDDSILELYYEFQKDINDSVVFPHLSIKRSKEKWYYCRIEYTDNLDVSLILGLDFGLQTSPDEFLIACLYHEFTHIWDKCKWLNILTDIKLKQKQLFPYTEFHAAQIELQKMIKLSTNAGFLNWVDGSIGKNRFVKMMSNETYNTFHSILSENKPKTFEKYLFLLSYNIGYYSVLREDSFTLSDLINLKDIEMVSGKVIELSEMLCNKMASDKLCFDSHNLMVEIICKLADNLSVKPEEWHMFLP